MEARSASKPEDPFASLGRDLLEDLAEPPRSIPPKYHYDARGIDLFNRITELPEYYLTSTEKALLRDEGEEIGRITRVRELFEIGPGSPDKARVLIPGLLETGNLRSYRAIEVSAAGAAEVVEKLRTLWPDLDVDAVVGDFNLDLKSVAPRPGRLAAFLGSTLGNLPSETQLLLLRRIRGLLEEDGWLLLGIDLVKDVEILEAAYNDSEGVTEEFNRNVLRMINTRLGADFAPDRFDLRARFSTETSAVESYLVARESMEVSIPAIDLELSLDEGEEIHMESSQKYTREMIERLLQKADLRLGRWLTDDDELFALCLATPAVASA